MPRVFRRKEEDPRTDIGAEPIAEAADLRLHTLTQELLDWAIAATEAVIRTNEFIDAPKRVRSAILDSYRLLDHLYPYIVEMRHANQVREGQGVVLGEQRAISHAREGSASGEGSVLPRVQEEGR